MLLLYRGLPDPAPDIPDVVTMYYPSENGIMGVEYQVNGTRYHYQYVSSENLPDISYRIEPSRR